MWAESCSVDSKINITTLHPSWSVPLSPGDPLEKDNLLSSGLPEHNGRTKGAGASPTARLQRALMRCSMLPRTTFNTLHDVPGSLKRQHAHVDRITDALYPTRSPLRSSMPRGSEIPSHFESPRIPTELPVWANRPTETRDTHGFVLVYSPRRA